MFEPCVNQTPLESTELLAIRVYNAYYIYFVCKYIIISPKVPHFFLISVMIHRIYVGTRIPYSFFLKISSEFWLLINNL